MFLLAHPLPPRRSFGNSKSTLKDKTKSTPIGVLFSVRGWGSLRIRPIPCFARNVGPHTPLEDLQVHLQGAERANLPFATHTGIPCYKKQISITKQKLLFFEELYLFTAKFIKL